MSSPNIGVCPQCNNAVDADSRFCKHCGFDFKASTPDIQHPQVPSTSPTKKSFPTLLVFAAALGVLCITLLAVLLFKTRQSAVQASTTPAAVTTAPNAPTISDRAQQVEARILRDESLSESDIAGLPANELRILRNIHFARYGRKYDQPELRDYFLSRPWYKPSDSYSASMVTETDKANVNVIKMAEDALKQPEEVTVSATPEPTPPPSSSSGNDLSESEMLRLMQTKGIVNGWDGRFHIYQNIEILRVGPFNEEKKYWPVKVRYKDGSYTFVYDVRITKNDYGDWEARRVG